MKINTTKILSFIIIVLLFLLLKTCKDCKPYQYEDPEGLITPNEAKAMIKSYKNNAYNYIDGILNNVNNSDTIVKYNREFWFDLNTVKNYIHYVEQKSDSLELNGDLGLRLYLGGKKTGGENIKTTLFFVPTINQSVNIINNNLKSNFTSTVNNNNTNITEIKPLNYSISGEPVEKYSVNNN